MTELAARGGEQLLAHRNVRIHRAAYVQEQQHLDAVASLGDEAQIQPSGVSRRPLDGRIQVELLGHALAREAAQPAQGNLHIARINLHRIVEIAERALIPNLDRAAAAPALLANADALRVVTVRAERAGARGPYPLGAALVPAALLLETLPERLHEPFPAAERLDPRFLRFAQCAFDQLADPLLRDRGNTSRRQGCTDRRVTRP